MIEIEIEKLKFTRDEKISELQAIKVDNFILNERIQQLGVEIANLNSQIKILEEKENGRED